MKTRLVLGRHIVSLLLCSAALCRQAIAAEFKSLQTETKYVLGRELGSGGFGQVYLATVKNKDGKQRAFAFKLWKEQHQKSFEGLRDNFKSAMELCKSLCSEGLHEIKEVGEFWYEDNFKLRKKVVGVVSELGKFDGSHMGDYLNVLDALKRGDYLQTRYRITVLSALLSEMALFQGKLAGQGYALNDIKPANLIVSSDSRLLFADFDGLTRIGKHVSIRTPSFAAPEIQSGNADRSSDLFAVGNTVLNWLTGGYTLVDIVWLYQPSLKPDPKNTDDKNAKYRAIRMTYDWLSANDPDLSKTLGDYFQKIIQSIRNIDSVTNRNATSGLLVRESERFMTGLRQTLAILPSARASYSHSFEGSDGKAIVNHFLRRLSMADCAPPKEFRSTLEKIGPTVIDGASMNGLNVAGIRGGPWASQKEIFRFQVAKKQNKAFEGVMFLGQGSSLPLDKESGRYHDSQPGWYLYIVDEFGNVTFAPNSVDASKNEIYKHASLYEFAREKLAKKASR